MKKLFCFIAVALAIALCSCGGVSAEEILSHERSPSVCSVSFSADGRRFEGRLTREDGGSMRLDVTSPESLAGMRFSLEEGSVFAEQEGTADAKTPLVEDESPVFALFDCFSLSERVKSGSLAFVSHDASCAVFSDGESEYELRFSSDGELESICRRRGGGILTIDICALSA